MFEINNKLFSYLYYNSEDILTKERSQSVKEFISIISRYNGYNLYCVEKGDVRGYYKYGKEAFTSFLNEVGIFSKENRTLYPQNLLYICPLRIEPGLIITSIKIDSGTIGMIHQYYASVEDYISSFFPIENS